jgi:predicted nuclease with TOPRIM domain
MSDKLEVLSTKIDEVLGRLEKLKSENTSLKDQDTNMRSELVSLKKQYSSVLLEKADQADNFRDKLVMVLDRLSQLETLID